jgi:hypothetical protein
VRALNTLAGFAVTGNTTYWMTTGVGGCPDRGSDGSEQPTCRLQRARLPFVPAGRPRGTATVPVPGRVDLSRDL